MKHKPASVKPQPLKLGRRPLQPTEHYPGSVAKLDVMAGRLLLGEGLFHPDDARVKSDEDVGPSTIERLVYSGSSRRSVIKTKVPGKAREWSTQRRVMSYIFTEKQWRRIQHLVPLRDHMDKNQRRLQLAQHRKAINGMLYVLFRGVKWTEMPDHYWYYAQKTREDSVYRVWHKWKQCGLWTHMLRKAGVVNEEDQIQWHRLQLVMVQAEEGA